MTGRLRLPAPPASYNQRDQAELRRAIETFLSSFQGLSGVLTSGGVVLSFNGRTGAILPLQADYDAFFLTPAEGNAAYAALSHTHDASAIVSGVIAQARLGSGSGGAGAKYLADDQTYKTFAHVHDAADITAGILSVSRGGTGNGVIPSGYLMIGNGTSQFVQLAFGAAGKYVRSNGASWDQSNLLFADMTYAGLTSGQALVASGAAAAAFRALTAADIGAGTFPAGTFSFGGSILPSTDAVGNLGSASFRFVDAFLSNSFQVVDAVGTGPKYARFRNAGEANGLYVGIEDSAGTFFGATAYQAVIYSPNLALKIHASSVSPTGPILTPASASGGANLRLPHGAAPSAPVNGDFWTTTVSPFMRINGVTQQLPDVASGTWTPTDQSGAALAFAAAVGQYTRIGKMVYATFSVQYPATASGATALLGGLPFTCVNSQNAAWGAAIGYTDVANLVVGVTSNSTTFQPYNGSIGAGFTNANLSGKYLRGTLIYEMA